MPEDKYDESLKRALFYYDTFINALKYAKNANDPLTENYILFIALPSARKEIEPTLDGADPQYIKRIRATNETNIIIQNTKNKYLGIDDPIYLASKEQVIRTNYKYNSSTPPTIDLSDLFSDVNKIFKNLYNKNKMEYSTNWLEMKTVYENTHGEKKEPEKPLETKNISNYKNTETISLYLLSFIYILFFYITYLFYDNLVTNSLAKPLALAYSMNDAASVWQTVNTPLNMKRVFLFLWVIVFLFSFVVGIIYLTIMNGKNTLYASKISTLCILGIVGATFLLVNSNLFVKVFENTVGYGWIQTTSNKKVDNIMNLLIEHNTFKSSPILPDTKLNLGFLLSIFRIDNFVNVLNDIKDETNTNKYDFRLRSSESMLTEFNKLYNDDRDSTYLTSLQKEMNKQKNIADIVVNDLAKLVIQKNTIGHLSWVYFSAIVSTVVSMKYLYRK